LEGPAPVAIDPQTKQAYVLIRKDVHDRMRAIIEGYTRRAG
jgi:hypothetical protein